MTIFKAYARLASDDLPDWVARIRYAEEFHCQPHEVGSVPVIWWNRWLMLKKAEHVRDLWDDHAHRKAGTKEPDATRKARMWALHKDKW